MSRSDLTHPPRRVFAVVGIAAMRAPPSIAIFREVIMAMRPYIVGNWKMNGTRAMLAEARAIDRSAQRLMKAEVALAPPFTLIHAVHKEAEQIGVGAQDSTRRRRP